MFFWKVFRYIVDTKREENSEKYSWEFVRDRLDIDYKMPIRVELSSEEAALLQICFALVLGEFFKINESGKDIKYIQK